MKATPPAARVLNRRPRAGHCASQSDPPAGRAGRVGRVGRSRGRGSGGAEAAEGSGGEGLIWAASLRLR